MNNFGTWKKGNMGSIVSDKPIENARHGWNDDKKAIKAYGGYVICESIGSEDIGNLLVSAPDLLEALKSGVKCPVCNGSGKPFICPPKPCTCCDGKGKLWSPEQKAAIAKAEGKK